MRPWHLGNTTVRSPFRLRDGLVALSTSQLQGKLRGQQQEIEFRKLLGERKIVELGVDESYSVGRKWRSALNKLGLLYPQVASDWGVSQEEVGPIDTITPNGWRIINSNTLPAMQECFLRAIAAYYIPSSLEPNFSFPVFSPLRHVLAVMLELEKQSQNNFLTFHEIALIVQLTSSVDSLEDVALKVLTFRADRGRATNKRRFDHEMREQAAQEHDYVASTFNDYADTNIRYLKATGLVQNYGRGISLIPEKRSIIEKLIEQTRIPKSTKDYIDNLCKGEELPTDNKKIALKVLNDSILLLKSKGVEFDVSSRPAKSAADIGVILHEIEAIWLTLKENKFAQQQASKWEEITAYMDLVIKRGGRKVISSGEEIQAPKGELPAYFEWVLWRAFLAIDNLVNKPSEARGFQVDQDLFPIGTASGNKPDLVFEFEDFVIVVEVTLTDNSRQEAAEGEPVRRHVANIMINYRETSGKQVYGLFIANNIDSNTAETFRIGAWYTNDDEKMQLDIVPLTLIQFKSFFEVLFRVNKIDALLVRELLESCVALRVSDGAPLWKVAIERAVNQFVSDLTNP